MIKNNSLNICHLYPKEMSLYGDRGNIIVLKYRAEERGINTSIQDCYINQEISGETNLIFLGGGQDSDQQKIQSDLLSKKNFIKNFLSNGGVFLAICGGYQFLGKYYEIFDSKTNQSQIIQGLDLIDMYTESPTKNNNKYKKSKRIIGNLKTYSEILGSDSGCNLCGFENHAGRTYINFNNINYNNKLKPLARVIQGGGNNSVDKTEGVICEFDNSGFLLGTYMHSFLPRNIKIADFLIQKALKLSYLDPVENIFEEINQKNALKLKY